MVARRMLSAIVLSAPASRFFCHIRCAETSVYVGYTITDSQESRWKRQIYITSC